MEPSIACAKAGVTTGEWGEALREIFGQYRAPTGVTPETRTDAAEREVRLMVSDLAEKLGETPRLTVGKPGLDGHSNGAEQIALRARDVGFDVTYDGIRQTPAEIVEKARATAAHVVGLSILSGSHVPLVREVMARMRLEGLGHIPVVVGGIIPPDDELVLRNIGVSRRLHAQGLRHRRDHGRHRPHRGQIGGRAAAGRPQAGPAGRTETPGHAAVFEATPPNSACQTTRSPPKPPPLSPAAVHGGFTWRRSIFFSCPATASAPR